MSNPFNSTLDWTLRGKYVEVGFSTGEGYRRIEGWVDRIHHNRSSVVLHDCIDADTDTRYGSVFIRTTDYIFAKRPKRNYADPKLNYLYDHPLHNSDNMEVDDSFVIEVHRDQWGGSYPVVRRHSDKPTGHYEIINGHKRIEAARRAGLERHPVEIVDVDDNTSDELYRLAHPNEFDTDDNSKESESDEATLENTCGEDAP